MPNYTFKNTKTNETWTEQLSMAERESFLKQNPHIQQLLVPAPTVDPYHLGRVKAEGGFRDVLSKIKGSHHGSNIDTGNLTQV